MAKESLSQWKSGCYARKPLLSRVDPITTLYHLAEQFRYSIPPRLQLTCYPLLILINPAVPRDRGILAVRGAGIEGQQKGRRERLVREPQGSEPNTLCTGTDLHLPPLNVYLYLSCIEIHICTSISVPMGPTGIGWDSICKLGSQASARTPRQDSVDARVVSLGWPLQWRVEQPRVGL